MKTDPAVAFRETTNRFLKGRGNHTYCTLRNHVSSHVDLHNAKVLDFGCGEVPVASTSFALRHPAAQVYGTDIVELRVPYLEALLKEELQLDMPSNIKARTVPPNTIPNDLQDLDLIYSWSVFEHIPRSDVPVNLNNIAERLRDTGVFFFQIGGLYFHDSGSHLDHLFRDRPWIHLVDSISEIQHALYSMDLHQRTKDHLWKQFIELNRMTMDEFLDSASDAGLSLVSNEVLKSGTPPRHLLNTYIEDTLLTSEFRAVFKRK